MTISKRWPAHFFFLSRQDRSDFLLLIVSVSQHVLCQSLVRATAEQKQKEDLIVSDVLLVLTCRSQQFLFQMAVYQAVGHFILNFTPSLTAAPVGASPCPRPSTSALVVWSS